MYISKKELLQMTGISYGQLYRWKREKLIPEEWFIKKPSYTGQETFFPREKVLERIRFIMEMKDSHSLEEIGEMLKVNPKKQELSFEKLLQMEEIEPKVVGLMEKEAYSAIEAALLEILSVLYREKGASGEALASFLEGMGEHFLKLENGNEMLTVVQAEGRLYGILHGENSQIKTDRRFTIAGQFSIEQLLGRLKQRYAKN